MSFAEDRAGLPLVFVPNWGNRAVVGNEYIVSTHHGGRAPPARFRLTEGKVRRWSLHHIGAGGRPSGQQRQHEKQRAS